MRGSPSQELATRFAMRGRSPMSTRLESLEDDSKDKLRCALVFSVEGHAVTGRAAALFSLVAQFVCHSDSRHGHVLRSGTASLRCRT